jgi:hypothetical protein
LPPLLKETEAPRRTVWILWISVSVWTSIPSSSNAEQPRASLDHANPGACPAEELRELARDESPAENDDAAGKVIQLQHVVARPKGGRFQAGQRGHADLRASGDKETLGPDRFPVVKLHGMRID